MAEDHIATRRAPDRSRGVRIAVSILGIVCCVIMTLTFREKSLGLLFGLAFSLAWWSEVARRLPVLMALGAAVILSGAAFRSGPGRLHLFIAAAAMSHGANTAANNPSGTLAVERASMLTQTVAAGFRASARRKYNRIEGLALDVT